MLKGIRSRDRPHNRSIVETKSNGVLYKILMQKYVQNIYRNYLGKQYNTTVLLTLE